MVNQLPTLGRRYSTRDAGRGANTGFRFRRSVRIMPGVRINLGKGGVTSVSVGRRGMTMNLNKTGTKTTFGFPGTGLSYVTQRTPARMPPLRVTGGIILALVLLGVHFYWGRKA
jgi:hypothetical protein